MVNVKFMYSSYTVTGTVQTNPFAVKICVEGIQIGGFITLSVIYLSEKFLTDMGDIIQCLDKVLSRSMRNPRILKAIVSSSLETVYKLPSLSGKVILPGRESFVLHF